MTLSTRFAARTFTIGALALLVVTAMPVPASARANTVLVSQSGGGVKGNDVSNEPSISQTGRWIAFNSGA